ncbi:MAG: DUF2156 domain-containing protein [Clostridia bacterium]|nr:DUF2156 domain-containing protein [Clostridia bacterium]
MEKNFKRLTVDARDEILPILYEANYGRCEYTFGTFLMYSEIGDYKYKIEDGVLFVKGRGRDGDFFYAPITRKVEKFTSSVKFLIREYNARGEKLKLFSVPSDRVEYLPKDNCTIRAGHADYVYDIVAFSELRGKKYHGKRNHISGFEREIGEYSFDKISSSNIGQVVEFFEKFRERESKDSEMFKIELEATATLLKNIDKTDFEGYFLSTHGQVIGFTVGEIVGDMLVVHVEKCDKSVRGVYEKIANCFVREMIAKYPQLKLVNREDDAGDEGLKKAKLSYNPLYMAEKMHFTYHVHDSV